jgi:hypothetical protein
MTDETFTALQYAGPASWHNLIAPTRTFPLTEGTAQAAALSMDSACGHLNDISAVYALTDLAATANILSNAIANTTFTMTALDIFKEARTAAHILHVTNRDTPAFTPTFRTYRHFKQAVDTRNPQVIVRLLVDVIRIAYHITES